MNKYHYSSLVFNQPRCHGNSMHPCQNARINTSVINLVSCRKWVPKHKQFKQLQRIRHRLLKTVFGHLNVLNNRNESVRVTSNHALAFIVGNCVTNTNLFRARPFRTCDDRIFRLYVNDSQKSEMDTFQVFSHCCQLDRVIQKQETIVDRSLGFNIVLCNIVQLPGESEGELYLRTVNRELNHLKPSLFCDIVKFGPRAFATHLFQ